MNVYSPDGKFEAGSYMDGMWSGPQGTDPRGGLFNQPSNPSNPQNYQGFNQTLGQPNAPQVGQGLMGIGQPNFMGQPQGMPPPTSPFGGAGVNFNIPNGQPQPMPSPQYPTENQQWVMGSNSDNGSYQPSTKFLDPNIIAPSNNEQQPQAKPLQSFFSGPNAGQMPLGMNMVNGEFVPNGQTQPSNNGQLRYDSYGSDAVMPQGYQQPTTNQFFQTPMQQQPNNPVNTQTVQPSFMGQTPFGQPQTGQYTSTNPFVQAAQANAQGNIAGALQATAANRINQQTPYGSLQYQQTGTDAQGNPIWSANQNLSPELQQLTQSSLAGLQASQANPMYGINPGDTYSNAIMQRLAPQQSQAREALDAQLANQGIMPGSEAYNRAKTLLGQTQNDALTSAIVGGMNTGIQAQNLQNTTAANIRNLATPGYVTPYNQATVAGPDYLSAYTSQNATDIARANAEAAQRSSLLGGLAGLGSSAILGGTGPNSALGGLYGLGSKGLEALGNTSLWNSLFGGTGPAITGDQDFLKSIGLVGSTYGSGTGGMVTDPLAGLFTGSEFPFAGYEDFLGF